MDKNLVRAAALATQSVFTDLVGWDLDVGGIVVKTGEASGGAELNAIIAFTGELSGAFLFHCSEELSGAIASSILGMECEPGSTDAKDAIGELLNMIVGGVKSHYNSHSDPFRLSVPTIVSGTDFSVHVKVSDRDEVIALSFKRKGGDEQFTLQLMLVS